MKTSVLTLALAATAYSQGNTTNSSLLTTLAGIPELSNLTTYFQPYQSMLSGLSNITLLAPNNAAFAAFLNSSTAGALTSDTGLLAAILDYHILNGSYANFTNTSFVPTALMPGAYANVTGGQRVEALGGGNATFLSGLLQNATVVNSTNFTGGVIHIIDRFLVLPQNISTSAVALNLTSAVGALTNLSLSDTVDNTRDLTVFIPDNEAFRAIGGNLANLSVANLTSILEYHVVPGRVLYSTDLMNDTSVPTLQGNNLTVYLEGSNVYVDNAKVTFPNVLVRNGVVHVIDRVLNPSNTTLTPNTATTEQAFPDATSASDVPYTSGVPTPSSAVDTSAVASAASSASSSGGAFRPIETGAIGMAALFGGAAAVMNM